MQRDSAVRSLHSEWYRLKLSGPDQSQASAVCILITPPPPLRRRRTTHLSALSAKIAPPKPLPDPLSLPIAGVELALAQWLLPHPHIPVSSLLFVEDDRLRILNTFAPPIPPEREFEDDLIHAFVATSEFYTVEHMDKPQLVSLYSRYRAVPNSITEDQRALVYAALCVARYIQSTEQGIRDGPLEDVTYFTMACDELLKWSRPSIYAACEYKTGLSHRRKKSKSAYDKGHWSA